MLEEADFYTEDGNMSDDTDKLTATAVSVLYKGHRVCLRDIECAFCAGYGKHIKLRERQRDSCGGVTIITYICPECNSYAMVRKREEKETEHD